MDLSSKNIFQINENIIFLFLSEVDKIVSFCKAVEIPEKLLGLLKEVLEKSKVKQVRFFSLSSPTQLCNVRQKVAKNLQKV